MEGHEPTHFLQHSPSYVALLLVLVAGAAAVLCATQHS